MAAQQVEIFLRCDCGEGHKPAEISVVVIDREVTRDYALTLLAREIKRYMEHKDCRRPDVRLVTEGMEIIPEVH